ncbi:hypothetical protein BJ508DRAFT_344927 [Ascobolus immersus RN42]|uniref:Uncharacterized protein n=1 Tax=Ascobolus immersus RN42 TaxID=1160509 RepID=A0A3N4IN06_ASCIM|nr:hypothetical protein BJ508DRAFT_344927 [Ascobolus immersus RN42]
MPNNLPKLRNDRRPRVTTEPGPGQAITQNRRKRSASPLAAAPESKKLKDSDYIVDLESDGGVGDEDEEEYGSLEYESLLEYESRHTVVIPSHPIWTSDDRAFKEVRRYVYKLCNTYTLLNLSHASRLVYHELNYEERDIIRASFGYDTEKKLPRHNIPIILNFSMLAYVEDRAAMRKLYEQYPIPAGWYVAGYRGCLSCFAIHAARDIVDWMDVFCWRCPRCLSEMCDIVSDPNFDGLPWTVCFNPRNVELCNAKNRPFFEKVELDRSDVEEWEPLNGLAREYLS